MHVAVSYDIADYEQMIYTIVKKFHRKYGGDVAELLQNARLAFLQAAESYDPTRGAFGPRMNFVVHRELFEHIRTAARRGGIMKIFSMSEIQGGDQNGDETLIAWGNESMNWDPVDPEPVSRFEAMDFLDGLSEDAVALLEHTFVVVGGGGCRLAAQAKSAVAEHFDAMGWATSRIKRAFSEIEFALGAS